MIAVISAVTVHCAAAERDRRKSALFTIDWV